MTFNMPEPPKFVNMPKTTVSGPKYKSSQSRLWRWRTVLLDVVDHCPYGAHSSATVGLVTGEFLFFPTRLVADWYEPKHQQRWPHRAYDVVRVRDTWYRTAPNFRQVIASRNPIAHGFTT